jgi:hypothetical protein
MVSAPSALAYPPANRFSVFCGMRVFMNVFMCLCVKRDVEVFDRCGLLTPNTVLAHGVYLTDDELRLLKVRALPSHRPFHWSA